MVAKSAVERALTSERRIREKGPVSFKFLMSPDLRLELDAQRGSKTLANFIRDTLMDHCSYLDDTALPGQMSMFDYGEYFRRAYAYEQRLLAPGTTSYKFMMAPELRLALEAHRDEMAIADFIRESLAKHSAWLGDPALRSHMSLYGYLNLAAEHDQRSDDDKNLREGGNL